MSSTIYSLIALLVIIRCSYQEETDSSNFNRLRRNFFMSSGPSRARVLEMERLVNSIFPRRTRDALNNDADTVADMRPVQAAIDNDGSNQPCFCPEFSRCMGKCHRSFRYW